MPANGYRPVVGVFSFYAIMAIGVGTGSTIRAEVVTSTRHRLWYHAVDRGKASNADGNDTKCPLGERTN
jgi:ribose 5-phosphate isomerase